MGVPEARRRTDLEKLRQFRQDHPGLLVRATGAGNPITRLQLQLSMLTAGSESYPSLTQDSVEMDIELPAEYPLAAPHVHISSPVFNPNVYPNGTVCIGPIWMATEGLDLFLTKIIRILAFDPQVVNPRSPANLAAAVWYEQRRLQYPKAFPTMNLAPLLIRRTAKTQQATMTWVNLK